VTKMTTAIKWVRVRERARERERQRDRKKKRERKRFRLELKKLDIHETLNIKKSHISLHKIPHLFTRSESSYLHARGEDESVVFRVVLVVVFILLLVVVTTTTQEKEKAFTVEGCDDDDDFFFFLFLRRIFLPLRRNTTPGLFRVVGAVRASSSTRRTARFRGGSFFGAFLSSSSSERAFPRLLRRLSRGAKSLAGGGGRGGWR